MKLYFTGVITLLCACSQEAMYASDKSYSDEGAYGEPSDVEDYYEWYSKTDFVPLQGISCGYMYLGHVNTVEFDLVWNGRSTDDEAEMKLNSVSL